MKQGQSYLHLCIIKVKNNEKTSENKISGVFLLHFLRNEVILSDFPFLGLSSLCKKERKIFRGAFTLRLNFPLSLPSYKDGKVHSDVI